MPDHLSQIKEIIEEHHTIRRHVKLVGESIGDREAVFTLQGEGAGTTGQADALSRKKEALTRTLSALSDGMKNHFQREEKYLPPVLGEILMQGLLAEHREIAGDLESLGKMNSEIEPDILDREGSILLATELQQKVGSLCNLIEEHAAREDLILGMVQKALEKTGK